MEEITGLVLTKGRPEGVKLAEDLKPNVISMGTCLDGTLGEIPVLGQYQLKQRYKERITDVFRLNVVCPDEKV